jgi:NADP-dependent 3-hydroxy acid dehydrogenase YdfG
MKKTPSQLEDYLPQVIHGKNILITGGTTGIGRATALMLAALGAHVFICGRHAPALEDTLEAYEKMEKGGSLSGIIADMAKEKDIEKLFEAADDRLGSLDVLINNAGLAYDSILEGGYEDWQYIVDVNLLGYMACANHAVKRMQKNKAGHIINIGSMSAETRGKDSSLYVATKAGVQAFSDAFRKEVNEMGIKVSLIEPGSVDTDMQPGSPASHEKKVEKMEMLKADDIAAAIVYVLSQPDRCTVVTLQVRPQMRVH